MFWNSGAFSAGVALDWTFLFKIREACMPSGCTSTELCLAWFVSVHEAKLHPDGSGCHPVSFTETSAWSHVATTWSRLPLTGSSSNPRRRLRPKLLLVTAKLLQLLEIHTAWKHPRNYPRMQTWTMCVFLIRSFSNSAQQSFLFLVERIVEVRKSNLDS